MTQTAAGQAVSVTKPAFGPVFAVVVAGVAMSNLDMFIVNVALPDIGTQFSGSSLASLSWILNAYAVVFAALLVPAGSLADRTSPRNAYLLGIAVFTVASALCAVAPGVWLLVAARVVQAIGAAMLIPSSLGLLLAAAPPEKRIPAVRGWTAISGLAAALGPVIGGLLTQLDWRWVFLVNLPIGVFALLLGARVLPRIAARPAAARLDLTGAVLLTLGIAVLALGLVKSEDWGWTSGKVLGSLLAAVVLLAAFVASSARHPSPVLPLGLLKIPGVGPATFANLLFAISFGAMLLSAVLWCQNVWHWSPLKTGLAIAPGPVLVPAFAMGVGPVIKRFGAAAVSAVGSVLFGAGIGWWVYRLDTAHEYAAGLLPGMLLTGVGVGMVVPTLVGAAVSALPPQSFSTGSAVVTMARQVGSVLGVALLVAFIGAPEGADAAVTAFDHGWDFVLVATALAAIACLFIPRPKKPAA
ncbi:MFS transporter [Streptosporangium nondiastaticum]|uniref:MFS transporter n=2 Tax=Actinomycetes TaxID=1760 RepID=A0A9X7JV05_9ACTN|nr:MULTISPECIES: MFS transporter [Actinomycetes]PSJ30226.1 MFS transporter [Streptosporangium nondiastaticum]WKU47932.1 MFS transporter [Streptomyces sp. VNUA116]